MTEWTVRAHPRVIDGARRSRRFAVAGGRASGVRSGRRLDAGAEAG